VSNYALRRKEVIVEDIRRRIKQIERGEVGNSGRGRSGSKKY